MKACKDCIHVHSDAKHGYIRCHHPEAYKELFLYWDATTVTVDTSIDHMRTVGACGHEAELFEPKEG